MSTLPLATRLRVWAWAAAARPLKHLVPLEWLVSAARSRNRRPRSAELEAALSAFLTARGRFPRRPPSNCLERCLGAYRILCEASATPELVVGFRREDGVLRGHVWIVVDGEPFGEPAPSPADHVAAVRYDAQGRKQASPDASA